MYSTLKYPVILNIILCVIMYVIFYYVLYVICKLIPWKRACFIFISKGSFISSKHEILDFFIISRDISRTLLRHLDSTNIISSFKIIQLLNWLLLMYYHN